MADTPTNTSAIVDAAWESQMNQPAQSPAPAEIDPFASSSGSDIDEPGVPSSSESAPSNSELDLSNPSEAPTKSDTSEYIYVSGPNGREKIKIDYSNKESIKKAFAAQAGMRKFQAERDSERAEKSKFAEKASNFDRLEKLWSEGGVEGLIKALDPQALDKIVQERLDRAEKRRNASDDEIRLMDLEEREAARERENQKLREQVEKQLNESKQREEAAQFKQMESQLHPQFHKYSFTGKLGDPKVENRYNQFLWSQAVEGLSRYPEDQQLTPAMVEREFREVALDLKKAVAEQSQEIASKAITAKKVTARENAGVQATRPASTGLNSNVREDLKKGNVGGALDRLFSAFGK